MAANVQVWNSSINARAGSELLCVNHVKHLDPHTSKNSGSQHLDNLKCYIYTEPQQVARKVLYTGPVVGATGPSQCGGAKVNPDNSAKKAKDGK